MQKTTAWLLTVGLILLAGWLVLGAYKAYLAQPWTRDGLVQADVILIAPRVSGPVRELHIRSNQPVKAGDLLFVVDPEPYLAALAASQAALDLAVAREEEQALLAQNESALHSQDPGAIGEIRWQQALKGLAAARAARAGAAAELRMAELRLGYTEVRAPADGFITNANLRVGTMAVAERPLFALIDKSTFRVTAYFRETLLKEIRRGAEARVTLMAYPDTLLAGEVESIDRGIARRNGEAGPDLLPAVSPTFDWIRLAQRVPVNIRLREIPPDVLLRVGTTASVQILSHRKND